MSSSDSSDSDTSSSRSSRSSSFSDSYSSDDETFAEDSETEEKPEIEDDEVSLNLDETEQDDLSVSSEDEESQTGGASRVKSKIHENIKIIKSSHHFDETVESFEQIKEQLDKPRKTLPFLTKYEVSRIVGERMSELGSESAVYLELLEKRNPYILERVYGGVREYVRVGKLEYLGGGGY